LLSNKNINNEVEVVVMKRIILMVVFALFMLTQAEGALLAENGDFELWTAGKPDSWLYGSTTVVESGQLNGTSSAQLTAQTGVSSAQYYFRQMLSTPISDYFYATMDVAFEDAPGSERDLNVNLQNVPSLTLLITIINLKYEAGTLSFYNGSSWVAINSSAVMSVSDFAAGTIHPYRLVFEGNLSGTYSLTITDLNTGTIILNQTGLNHYQNTSDRIEAVNFDMSRGNNRLLLDNFAVYSEDPRLPIVNAGEGMTLVLPTNSMVMNPTISNTGTPLENLTVQWTKVSGPEITFSSVPGETANDLNAHITFTGGRGVYVLKLAVTDEFNYTGEDTISIRVKNTLLDDVLLGHWGFEDQPQGTIAADMLDAAAGNTVADDGFLATLSEPNSVPDWISGWVGNASLEFDGGVIVDVNDVASQDPNLAGLRWEMTAAGWIIADPAATGYRTLIGRFDPFNWVVRKSLSGNGAEFVLQMEDDLIWVSGTTNIRDGYWHHLAGTFDGQQAVFYVDGIEDASVQTRGLIKQDLLSQISIGARRGSDHSLVGMADDVRVYSYALTPAEIIDLAVMGVNTVPRVQIDPGIPTELIKQFNDTVQLNATVTDINTEDVISTLWSVPDAGQAAFVNFGDAGQISTSATFSQAGAYTLRLTVNDGNAGLEGDIYDEITITVNEPVCDDLLVYDAGMDRFINPMMTADISGPADKPDCYVDIHDLAQLSVEWLLCNDPEGVGCTQP
jgi:hypothetical protein